MSSQRAQANHSLYLAKIQLAAWREQRAQEQIPATVLSQAFLPAIRHHLVEAYGWFLLNLIDVEATDGTPPVSVDTLPPIPPGKALPGDLNELRRLEQSGWLAELLAPVRRDAASPSSAANLAVAGPAAPGPDDVAAWCSAMGEVIDRIGDTLDES